MAPTCKCLSVCRRWSRLYLLLGPVVPLARIALIALRAKRAVVGCSCAQPASVQSKHTAKQNWKLISASVFGTRHRGHTTNTDWCAQIKFKVLPRCDACRALLQALHVDKGRATANSCESQYDTQSRRQHCTRHFKF